MGGSRLSGRTDVGAVMCPKRSVGLQRTHWRAKEGRTTGERHTVRSGLLRGFTCVQCGVESVASVARYVYSSTGPRTPDTGSAGARTGGVPAGHGDTFPTHWQRPAAWPRRPRVGGSLLVILGQFVSHFVSARISDVSATYQRCISVSALSRS